MKIAERLLLIGIGLNAGLAVHHLFGFEWWPLFCDCAWIAALGWMAWDAGARRA